MRIGFLATGNELIQGDTLNTNTHHLAHVLHSEGLSLGMHLACSDDDSAIVDAIAFLSKHHDMIIITGGLGPTSDDRTRFGLARFLKQELVEFPEAMDSLKARFSRSNLTINAGNKQQAFFPKGAHLIPNAFGTAMGCYLKMDRTWFVLLPGPPKECWPMFDQHVLPLLTKMEHSDLITLKWRLFGVSEGQIAERLDAALAGQACVTGYRLETPYLEFKVRCSPPEIPAIKSIIEPLVSSHIIASVEKRASECLREHITALQVPIYIRDEVTGGVLQSLIQKPSNVAWLSFHEADSSRLQFHLSGLEDYWANRDTVHTRIRIDYDDQGQTMSESHELPSRRVSIRHYAAEWLSFRLFHLINQLHQ